MRRKKLIIGGAIEHKSKVKEWTLEIIDYMQAVWMILGTIFTPFTLSILLTHYEGCPHPVVCLLLPQSRAGRKNTILSSVAGPSCFAGEFSPLKLIRNFHHPLLDNVFRSHQSQPVISHSSISPHFFTLISSSKISNIPLNNFP